MEAITAYNVIKALPEEELPKLYKMLGFTTPNTNEINKLPKNEKRLSKVSAEEYLRATIFSLKKE